MNSSSVGEKAAVEETLGNLSLSSRGKMRHTFRDEKRDVTSNRGG